MACCLAHRLKAPFRIYSKSSPQCFCTSVMASWSKICTHSCCCSQRRFVFNNFETRIQQNIEFSFFLKATYIDTSHFFWLITYFLKFTSQLELDLDHVKQVLSYDIISYLTYEAVSLCEELELLTSHDGNDVLVKPCLRRMHLVNLTDT